MDTGTLYGFASFGITGLVLSVVLILYFLLYFLIYKYPEVFGSMGQALIMPLKFLWNLGILTINFLKSLFINNDRLIGKDNCAILPGSGEAISRVPSAYLAHVAFFFAFLFTNAYYVYIKSEATDTSSTQYENRRYRSAMIMATIITLYIIIVFARYNITGCDSSLGIVFTTLAFGALGFGTYKLAEICGARSADILGISSSFVPDSAQNTAPLACGTKN